MKVGRTARLADHGDIEGRAEMEGILEQARGPREPCHQRSLKCACLARVMREIGRKVQCPSRSPRQGNNAHQR